jgi:hypothetical protein
LATVAVTVVVELVCTDVAIGATVTMIGGGGAIVATTVAVAPGLVVDFAVIVTVVPVAIASGGV